MPSMMPTIKSHQTSLFLRIWEENLTFGWQKRGLGDSHWRRFWLKLSFKIIFDSSISHTKSNALKNPNFFLSTLKYQSNLTHSHCILEQLPHDSTIPCLSFYSRLSTKIPASNIAALKSILKKEKRSNHSHILNVN